jgi:uncharacterized membrane protein YbhN (UPF0104 family)
MSRRRLLTTAGLVLLAYLVAMVLVLQRIEVPPLGVTTVALVAAAGVVQLAAKWLFGLLFRDGVMASGSALRPSSAFKGALVGAGVARLIPAGGAITPVAMAWTVRREAVGSAGAALRATMLNYAGLLMGTGFALLWIRGRGLYVSWQAGMLAGAVVSLVIGSALMFGTGWLGRASQVLPARWRRHLGESLHNHRLGPGAHGLLWGRLALEAAVLAMVMTAFGLDLTPTQTFAAFGVSQLAGGLPGTPGGIGYTEAGLVGVLAFFGFAVEVTVAPILFFRLVSYWLPALAGLVAGGMTFMRSSPYVEQPAGL